MKQGKTEKLGDIIREVLSKRALSGRYQLRQIRKFLDVTLNNQERGHIRVGSIKRGCLFLFVDSPSLVYEMEAFRSDDLLKKIREAGHKQIEKIRFKFESHKK